jgi:hypothetical protein
MTLGTYTLIHVVISLIGIAAGFVVIFGMIAGKRLNGWTALFLTTTVLTSITGFGFLAYGLPASGFSPGEAIGIISMIVLVAAIYGRYARQMAGHWRWIYVVAAVVAQYLNFLVLIVQSFEKISALHELAPTQHEPPFQIAQGVALVVFLVLGVLAAWKFRPAPVGAA